MENKENTKSKIDFKWYIALFFLVTGLASYFYKDYQLNNFKKDVVIKVDSVIAQENKRLLIAISKPLVFASRADLLRNKIDEINILFADLVKGNNILSIDLINIDGNVLASTNKKLEGSKAPANLIKFLEENQAKIYPLNDSIFTVAAPVMGYNSKLGVIVMNYRFTKFKL